MASGSKRLHEILPPASGWISDEDKTNTHRPKHLVATAAVSRFAINTPPKNRSTASDESRGDAYDTNPSGRTTSMNSSSDRNPRRSSPGAPAGGPTLDLGFGGSLVGSECRDLDRRSISRRTVACQPVEWALPRPNARRTAPRKHVK